MPPALQWSGIPAEAVELARRHVPDVVLMDLRMPGMDGLTAIELLRAGDSVNRDVPVIVVTADTAVDLRERCLAAGADEIIVKPVAMAALLEAMGRLSSRDDEDDIILD